MTTLLHLHERFEFAVVEVLYHQCHRVIVIEDWICGERFASGLTEYFALDGQKKPKNLRNWYELVQKEEAGLLALVRIVEGTSYRS